VPKDQDPDRPLSTQGQSDIQRLAGRLAEYLAGGGPSGDMGVGCILHSDKLRAEQTARIIADSLESSVSVESCSGISPNDNAAAFVEERNLEQCSSQGKGQQMDGDAGSTMIVSHMPFVSNLCSTLLTGSTEVEFDFTPGTLVCLFYEYEEWSMEYMVRPEFY